MYIEVTRAADRKRIAIMVAQIAIIEPGDAGCTVWLANDYETSGVGVSDSYRVVLDAVCYAAGPKE